MAQAQQQRFVFIFDRLQKGWDSEIAGPVAWALIPFDDAPVPPRNVEKQVRKRAKVLAKSLRMTQSSQTASLNLATEAACDYVEIARQAGAQYFVELWTKLKEQAEAAKS
jgi:hypothetical protein